MNLRATGDGYFVWVKTRPYFPLGSLFGQIHDDSCVAACCRMLLCDEGRELSEAAIRAALTSDCQGAYLSIAAMTLPRLGSRAAYEYRDDLRMADLLFAVSQGPAIVFLKDHPQAEFGHALIVDKFDGGLVCLRDPWPQGIGSAYQVSMANFEKAWLVHKRHSGFTGQAVVLK